MIRNLLSNAVRYTDRGSILVGCRRAGDKVRIEVWDSGVGIMGEQMPRIFEEHYQGSQSAQSEGFGLGLAIVQRLGNILGHQIAARSTPGKGSVFSIEVPLACERPKRKSKSNCCWTDRMLLSRARSSSLRTKVLCVTRWSRG